MCQGHRARTQRSPLEDTYGTNHVSHLKSGDTDWDRYGKDAGIGVLSE